jgi:hypothetical protein
MTVYCDRNLRDPHDPCPNHFPEQGNAKPAYGFETVLRRVASKERREVGFAKSFVRPHFQICDLDL